MPMPVSFAATCSGVREELFVRKTGGIPADRILAIASTAWATGSSPR